MARLPRAGDRAILIVEVDGGERVACSIEIDAIRLQQKGLVRKTSGELVADSMIIAVAGLTSGFEAVKDPPRAVPS